MSYDAAWIECRKHEKKQARQNVWTGYRELCLKDGTTILVPWSLAAVEKTENNAAEKAANAAAKRKVVIKLNAANTPKKRDGKAHYEQSQKSKGKGKNRPTNTANRPLNSPTNAGEFKGLLAEIKKAYKTNKKKGAELRAKFRGLIREELKWLKKAIVEGDKKAVGQYVKLVNLKSADAVDKSFVLNAAERQAYLADLKSGKGVIGARAEKVQAKAENKNKKVIKVVMKDDLIEHSKKLVNTAAYAYKAAQKAKKAALEQAKKFHEDEAYDLCERADIEMENAEHALDKAAETFVADAKWVGASNVEIGVADTRMADLIYARCRRYGDVLAKPTNYDYRNGNSLVRMATNILYRPFKALLSSFFGTKKGA